MNTNIEARLKAHINFPTPPGIAQQIVMLANDPEVHITTLADTIAQDPGLATKILRIANSALYARRRRSDNLRQALMVLGLKAATTLALSFSLAPLFRNHAGFGLDYSRCWRRALLAAMASRTLGELLDLRRPEDLFLAGLLQDIAMLALDRTKGDFYAQLPSSASHAEACRYEIARLDADHAAVGGILLKHWNLPDFLVEAVVNSHVEFPQPADDEAGRFARCVAFAGTLAEFIMDKNHARDLAPIEAGARAMLGLDRGRLGETLATLVKLVPEIEQLFNAQLLDAADTQSLMDQARDLLAIRSLESLEQVSSLQAKSNELEKRTAILQDQSRRDGLTGLFNRAYLETALTREFATAVERGWPLAVIFIDLDHFKRVNDSHGHPAGDTVLRAAAAILSKLVRATDLVARYGGEEFVVVLPGTDIVGGQSLCTRITNAMRSTTYEFAQQSITVTASLGLAVHSDRTTFGSVDALIKAADEAVYLAKNTGRDRFVCFSR